MKSGEKRRIELLAPAKNLECGLEAVRHGADAVYIGAPRFGARAAAGNPLEDIARLTDYAHQYGVRVYVTVNTLLTDDELGEAERMVWGLYRIGVDALIVQDMGLTRLHLPPIPLHASTQTDNRTAEKVRFLAGAGFRRVVLARELTLREIGDIHAACPGVQLEAFVHGAVCVSYSGLCLASQACYGRSANRGECAQFCRMPFDLTDADGRVIGKGKHWLSMKDLNLADHLEELLDAGVTSLKIEGRLKDVAYVKNVTAAYRLKLDELMARRKEYARASAGRVRLKFTPCLEKSFNRGFTSGFLHGRGEDVASLDTPKATGERMGTLKEQRGNSLVVTGVKTFHNGDGICWVDAGGRLQGTRVNRVEGNRLFTTGDVPRIPPGTTVCRNHDQAFVTALAGPTAERKLGVCWELAETAWGFALTATDEEGHRVTMAFACEKLTARTPQAENLRRVLARLGDTPFELRDADSVKLRCEGWFIPASVVADWRRLVTDRLLAVRRICRQWETAVWHPTTHPYPDDRAEGHGPVMNAEAAAFCRAHGVASPTAAYEVSPVRGAALMTCKHCLRYSMGWCPVHQDGRSPYREPYFLTGRDGRQFRLEFDCRRCVMVVREAEG